MKRKILILSLILLSNLINLSAQISHGGEPLSFKNKALKSMPIFNTPSFNYQQMIKEDEEQTGMAKPFRYGKMHQVNINPETSGVWQQLDDGGKIWRMQIRSADAYAVGVFFGDFQLNKGVRFYIYTPDREELKGAFTSKNNKESSVLSVLPLPGEEIVLELNVPNGTDYGNFSLSGIIHDYKNVFGLKYGYGSSGNCNINVNCPEGADWQNEKRSVVKYSYVSGSSTYLCTGALVNNSRQDATPYILTAQHCISSSTVAESGIFMFNYESEDCEATGNPDYQSISAASLIATGGNLDFTLLRLSSAPPADFNVYYSGWNHSTVAATNTVTIHHPSGDIKKISFDNDPVVTGNYGSSYVTNSHWNIIEWDLGTTEGGSSGSPLYDENHRIVGDLTGGDASCSNNVNDFYAKFDMSWDYYADASQQLKAWLDPDNSSIITLDGFDPNVIAVDDDAKMNFIDVPVGDYCIANAIVPTVQIKNEGRNNLTSIQINYQINGGTVATENWTGSLTTYQTETVLLNSIYLPVGRGTFKAYTSLPNGVIDEDSRNDTLVSEFTGIEDVDIRLVKIIDPNGAYCTANNVQPKLIIENLGNPDLTNLTINTLINNGDTLTAYWAGLLQKNEVDTLILEAITLPNGYGQFKAYISLPDNCNGNDLNDDTLVAQFEGQRVIDELLVEGNQSICSDFGKGNYFTKEPGEYFWTVNDGKIIFGKETDSITVRWDEWGQREVNLMLRNLCGDFTADVFKVEPGELAMVLEIKPADVVTFWLITDGLGDTIAQGQVEPSTTITEIPICLDSREYKFKIYSVDACASCYYQLTSLYSGNVSSEGSYSSAVIEDAVELDPTIGLATYNVYPNPPVNLINIEANFTEAYNDAVFSIYNLDGKLVIPENRLTGRMVVDISELRKGYYIIKITSAYGEFVKSFVKP